jgi:hypothetical protein
MRLAALVLAPASMHEICSSAIDRYGTDGLLVGRLVNFLWRDLASPCLRCPAVAAEAEDVL